MNLALDIGNTRSKIGLFDKHDLQESKVITDWDSHTLIDYCHKKGVQKIILSSVAAPDIPMQKTLAQHFDLLELTHQTPLPFKNRYTTPHTLGKDRLAAVSGAQALLPGQHCLVVDCGTCIKYDILTSESEYLGGNIAPGAKMRAKAMHTFTARLPDVSMEMPADFIGTSTETALQNGAFLGAVMEIEHFVGRFQTRFDPLQVLLTGGDTAFFQPFLNINRLRTEPHLTLYGLNNILNFNS